MNKQKGCHYCLNGSEASDNLENGTISIYHEKKTDTYYLIASSSPALGYDPSEVRSRPLNNCPWCDRDLRSKKKEEQNG